MTEPEDTREKTGAGIERGAQEEASGTPLTETEVEASRRPPSEPAGPQE